MAVKKTTPKIIKMAATVKPEAKPKRGRPAKSDNKPADASQALPKHQQGELFTPPHLTGSEAAKSIMAYLSSLSPDGAKLLLERIQTSAEVTQRHVYAYPERLQSAYAEWANHTINYFKNKTA